MWDQAEEQGRVLDGTDGTDSMDGMEGKPIGKKLEKEMG
jgi:hypothetical protein